jgi:pyrroloquinoline-quinone synthase
MTTSPDVRAALSGRELLSHPFYRRWEAGELVDGELATYGSQYAHFERQLPVTLARIVHDAHDDTVRALVQANLDDELGTPMAHVELLDSFLDAVGAVPADPTQATAALTELYATAPDQGTAFALGVLAAYEVQSAEIARSKAEGLRAFYGLSANDTAFWDVHATLEEDHATWVLDAAASVDLTEFLSGVAASRDAWWAFLDEREAAFATA